jgi:hypothetical protein
MKLSKAILHELELLGSSPDEAMRALRAQGITSLDHVLAQCLHSMVKQTGGKELVAWPPMFAMQERSEKFLASRWPTPVHA